MERVNKLKEQLAEKKRQLEELLDTKPTDMWQRDLASFREIWELFESDGKNGCGRSYRQEENEAQEAQEGR